MKIHFTKNIWVEGDADNSYTLFQRKKTSHEKAKSDEVTVTIGYYSSLERALRKAVFISTESSLGNECTLREYFEKFNTAVNKINNIFEESKNVNN